MTVPDLEHARRILSGFSLPEGIVVHSEGVRRVAVEAARLVAASGIPVDERLVEAAALLHDVDKVEIRTDGGEHGIVGARRLEALGLEELAMPVASHPLNCLLDDDRFPRGWPSVIVAVADRRVGEAFCSIDERLDDMKRRHADYAESIEAAWRPAHALETEVLEATGLGADELDGRLRAAWEAGA
jgi:uncharacterized protein